MTAAQVLETIRSRGVQVERRDENLVLKPKAAVTVDVLDLARAYKPLLLLELASPEVRWRARAMATQVPSEGLVRLLVARDAAWPDDGAHCISCGDRFTVSEGGPFGVTMRCPACLEAATLALAIAPRVLS